MTKASNSRIRKMLSDYAQDLVTSIKILKGQEAGNTLNLIFLTIFKAKQIPKKSELKKAYTTILKGKDYE